MAGDRDNCGNKVSSRRQKRPRQPAPGEESGATKASLTERGSNDHRWMQKTGI